MAGNEIFIETLRIGKTLRVTAIDAESGLEVIFQAPANTSRKKLTELASSKLLYVMSKSQEDEA